MTENIILSVLMAFAAMLCFCAEYFDKRGTFWETVWSGFGLIGCACLTVIFYSVYQSFLFSVKSGFINLGAVIVVAVLSFLLCYGNRNAKMEPEDWN